MPGTPIQAAPRDAPILRPGENCWRIARADRAALIVDAAGYFRAARRAMLDARSQILLIGWNVDTRVRLDREEHPSGAPAALGPFLSWLTRQRPALRVHILVWDEGLLEIPGRGTTALRLLRWWLDKRVSIKWDGTHPLDASHHQKILVIDDAIAFCGGIDITGRRWDTRQHRDRDPRRRHPFTRRGYPPWHDATMAVDGDAARALGELARERWQAATGEALPAPAATGDSWPDALEPTFREARVAIARTRGHEEPSREVREIEALFVDLVGVARRFVYVETQYFSSRVVAEAIARRLAEPAGPEFVIVNPRTAEGWLEEVVMGAARHELMKALAARDRHRRFRVYAPVTAGGADIYVHAKIMIVDDAYLRVGSANLNNRSMGLDSECDLLIDGTSNEVVRRMIAGVRDDLLAEHLAATPAEVARCLHDAGSLIGAVEALRGRGRTLVPFEPPEPNTLEKWVARSELLDTEAPHELFEPRGRPGLLSGLGR